MHRRQFIQQTALAATAATLLPNLRSATPPPPAMLPFTLDLNPGIIGVSANTQTELLEMAVRHGFQSITPLSGQLAEMNPDQLEQLAAARAEANIAWGSTNLPVEFRRDEATFHEGLANLDRHGAAMQRAGATRMNTWIMPTHPDLHYSANMRQHADRLRECGRILDRYGIQLGLEYVGAKTLMARDRFAFIRTMIELQELLADIALPNVGYVLDTFHWHCAEDTAEQILALDPATIASVDLNDARSDLSRDAQIDGSRHLPLATGVIDIKSFLQALVQINYTGPVRAEPFNQALNDLDNEAALAATHKSMTNAFNLVR